MGKTSKAEKRRGGGLESKVVEDYTPLPIFQFTLKHNA